MTDKKDRVIAIDYFRGICILMVVLNHAVLFSLPFAYLTGVGSMWTSAAEMFFLLSGLTFGIIRGDKILTDFKAILKKTYRRVFSLYVINTLYVFASLAIALTLVAHGKHNYIDGILPSGDIYSIILRSFALSYSLGWASFLMYYVGFLAFAPFLMYVLRTRLWMLVPLGSFAIFMANASEAHPTGIYYWFSIWQVYYVMGLVIARFRLSVLPWFYGLRKEVANKLSAGILLTAGGSMAVSALLGLSIYPTVAKLAQEGWLPLKLQGAYIHLLNHKPTFDHLLMASRSGYLRPFVAVLVLAAGYLLYQKHKDFLLSRTGYYVNALGRDTLWIFVAQAAAIPALSALPVPHNIITNIGMTSLLVYMMWLVTKRHMAMAIAKGYINLLSDGIARVKYVYLYRAEDNF